MFDILILPTFYDLTIGQVEYQIRDRLSFACLLGLGIKNEVPDAPRCGAFVSDSKELGLLEQVFNRIAGLRTMKFRKLEAEPSEPKKISMDVGRESAANATLATRITSAFCCHDGQP